MHALVIVDTIFYEILKVDITRGPEGPEALT